jgi:tetratricopeptide (TPR) repeat protein
MLGLHEEGIKQAEKALRMYEQLEDTVGQAESLHSLAQLLLRDDQLEAAEEIALQPTRFLPERGEEFLLCKSHRVLGEIYRFKKENKKAVDHLETALGIATPFGWRAELSSIHYDLASLFYIRKKYDDASFHAERAKSHTIDHAHHLGRAMEMQAQIWYRQRRLEDARSEALAALGIHEKLGVAQDAGRCDNLLRRIERAMSMRSRSPSIESDMRHREFVWPRDAASPC